MLENTDGTKVYPVYELVIGLAQDFKKDNEHLVELAIALQLFEKISSYVEMELHFWKNLLIMEKLSLVRRIIDIMGHW